ncbi:Rpn family recombination-promoting nuclease/putative transposase [Armatimonas sp.]|uniref:Rpn family recombination-promoting nuclease/putative transposase n=1 Tax=Armatimonas sp. TaxID=1872638 RepID=UPI00375300C1
MDEQAIDHDRLFKELLTTFFIEFVQGFLPDVAAYLDPDSIEFLDKEVFTDVTQGKRYESDIIVKARFQGKEAYFLLIVENQSTPQSGFPKRMFGYFARFYEKFDLPIYPVVIYSFDKPRRLQPGKHEIAFPGFVVSRFQFRVIQLNRLKWRDYVSTPNPVATALMSKMQIARRDRVKVKVQCLRLIATLRLDPARSQLIAGFVRTYLQMTKPELVELQREVGLLPREELDTMMTLTNEWIELGEEKGIEQGMERGRAAEARSLILRWGTKRLGAPGSAVEAALEASDLARLEVLADRLPEAESWQELLAE